MAKQQFLDGMEPPSIPKIDKLADEYAEARYQRMALLKEEINKRDLLQIAMQEEGLESYETPDGKKVVIDYKSKLKVLAQKAEDEAAEDE